MAVNHISFNDALPEGRALRSMLRDMEQSHIDLPTIIRRMAQMIDGDGSQDAHYTYMTTQFGFASDAKAHEAFNELNSLQSKFNTDASVTFVNAAMLQAFAKFG